MQTATVCFYGFNSLNITLNRVDMTSTCQVCRFYRYGASTTTDIPYYRVLMQSQVGQGDCTHITLGNDVASRTARRK